MKKIIFSVSLVLTSTLACLTSCNNSSQENKTTTIIVDGGKKIVDQGISEYSIIIPNASVTNHLSYASKELKEIISDITGADLEIYNEEEVSSYPTDKVISLGETSLYKQNELTLPDPASRGFDAKQNYYYSGYYIKTIGNNIFINSDESYKYEGVLYGVYELLHILTGFEVYAPDETYFNQSNTIYFQEIDKVDIPTFDVRELSYREFIEEEKMTKRMRMMNKENDSRWATFGHTLTGKWGGLLNYDKYQSLHPDWFSRESGSDNPSAEIQWHLCYTARGNKESYNLMVDTIARNMYENHIKTKPNAEYFMLGQADSHIFCECEGCLAKSKEYDEEFRVSTLQVLFLNDVVDRIYQIMEDAHDEVNLSRNLKFPFFGYEESIVPSYSNKLHVNDRLYIVYAPIEMNYTQDMNTSGNAIFYNHLCRWNELMPNRIIVYSYDCNYLNYVTNFPNFSSISSHYQSYYDAGVTYFYSQGAINDHVSALTYMRMYVESKLMWNKELQYDELASDFFKHYYKDAANAIQKYYDITRNRYDYYIKAIDQSIGTVYASISDAKIWEKRVVDALKNALDEGLNSIEYLKNKDAELYDTLYFRIKREYLTVLYLYLVNWRGSFTSQEVSTMLDEWHYLCDYFGLTKTREGGTGLPF